MSEKIIVSGFFDPCSSIRLEDAPKPTYMGMDLIRVTVHGIPVLNSNNTVVMKVERQELLSALEQLKKEE